MTQVTTEKTTTRFDSRGNIISERTERHFKDGSSEVEEVVHTVTAKKPSGFKHTPETIAKMLAAREARKANG